jgi:LCP family protein required for cell wall assembly
MDESTQRNTPDDHTRRLDANGQANQQRGASESEFTQVSPRQDAPPKYEYAIPQAEQTAATPRIEAPIQRPAPMPFVPQPQQYAAPSRPTRKGLSWVWIAVVGLVFAGTVVVSLVLFVVLRVVVTSRGTATLTPAPVVAAPTGTAGPTPTVGLGIQPWDGKHRLTILTMGIDKRPNDPGTAFRTDSMMIISIDPATKSVGILSIPRDLFVDIPSNTVVRDSYGLQRVNAAYVIGELARPGYGAQLAMQTVQYNLGMHINNYFVFDFNTVISGINYIGGVDINVPTNIYDSAYPDMYYGYDPLRIPAGMTHMDGALALKYARTRHQTSDFDRVKRQQQVIMAAREKILNANLLPQLIVRSPEIWNQLSNNIHTDLTLDQLLQLVVYLKDIPKENIHQGVIDISEVTGLNYNGADVLVPERAKLGPLLTQIFGASYAG